MFVKLGQRRAQAISIVHLAAVLGLDGEGPTATVRSASLALGSVAPTVVSATAAEEHLAGRPLDEATIAEAARLAADGVTPIDDVRATAVYRSEEIAVMVSRALAALRDGRERERWPARPVFLWGPSRAASAPVPAASHDDATPVSCTINGRAVSAAGAAGVTLLDWLRDELDLTGTKEGCAEGECGACTVHLDGAAVLSCLVPAARAHGAEITTIEGLAPEGTDGQDGQARGWPRCSRPSSTSSRCSAASASRASSCPATALLQECPAPTRDDAALGLSGNLCRCTGYYRFYEAVEQAAGR